MKLSAGSQITLSLFILLVGHPWPRQESCWGVGIVGGAGSYAPRKPQSLSQAFGTLNLNEPPSRPPAPPSHPSAPPPPPPPPGLGNVSRIDPSQLSCIIPSVTLAALPRDQPQPPFKEIEIPESFIEEYVTNFTTDPKAEQEQPRSSSPRTRRKAQITFDLGSGVMMFEVQCNAALTGLFGSVWKDDTVRHTPQKLAQSLTLGMMQQSNVDRGGRVSVEILEKAIPTDDQFDAADKWLKEKYNYDYTKPPRGMSPADFLAKNAPDVLKELDLPQCQTLEMLYYRDYIPWMMKMRTRSQRLLWDLEWAKLELAELEHRVDFLLEHRALKAIINIITNFYIQTRQRCKYPVELRRVKLGNIPQYLRFASPAKRTVAELINSLIETLKPGLLDRFLAMNTTLKGLKRSTKLQEIEGAITRAVKDLGDSRAELKPKITSIMAKYRGINGDVTSSAYTLKLSQKRMYKTADKIVEELTEATERLKDKIGQLKKRYLDPVLFSREAPVSPEAVLSIPDDITNFVSLIGAIAEALEKGRRSQQVKKKVQQQIQSQPR